MIRLLTSKYIGYLVSILALIALVGLYGQVQYNKGYKDRDVINQLEIARLNDEIRMKEKAWGEEVRTIEEKHYAQLSEYKSTIDKLNRNISGLNKRLYVKVKRPVCANQTDQATSMDDGTARAELDSRTATDIIGLMAKGDQAIIQLNALQDWAEKISE